MKPFTLYEVVKILEVAPIEVPGEVGESYKFRIEILQPYQAAGSYYARVYRRETYRLQPTFPLIDGEPDNTGWDHEILVIDEAIDGENCTGQSVQEVLEKVTRSLDEIFNLAPCKNGK